MDEQRIAENLTRELTAVGPKRPNYDPWDERRKLHAQLLRLAKLVDELWFSEESYDAGRLNWDSKSGVEYKDAIDDGLEDLKSQVDKLEKKMVPLIKKLNRI